MAWNCGKCGVEMEEVMDIKLTYNNMDMPDGTGLRCPSCGAEYLTEEYVVGELNASEQIMEGK